MIIRHPLDMPHHISHTWQGNVRTDEPELLDLGLGSPAEVAANLTEMWRINRYLGGLRALTQHLYPRLRARPGPVTVIDLGTGSADVPKAIVRWAWVHHVPVRIFAVDWAARNLEFARTKVGAVPEVTLLHADAHYLPFPVQGVDFVISSLFLHHFSEVQAIHLLRSAFAHARQGIIMSDLVRGKAPYTAFKLLQPLVARNALTRHDGALSIQRAYTPTELMALARAAGLSNARVYTHWPWRMTLVADKGLGL